MEETGVVTNTNTSPTNVNKNKFVVGGLFIGILLLIGAIFLFGMKKQAGPGPASGPTPTIVLQSVESIDQELDVAVKIDLTSTGFFPKVVTVKKGARVIWYNKSGANGSVNSDDHPTHLLYPPLNFVGFFIPDTSVQAIFEEPGTFGYHNHLKPEQTGTLIVE